MSEKKKIGSYEVVKTIGRGSFGVVTAVKDHQGNIFVVKQLDMSCMNYKEKRNVVNELKALIEVSVHPFIVRYKEAFVDDSILCVAMDFCPKGDLGKYIKRKKEKKKFIPEKKIRRWLLQIITALNFLHDKKLIHRDLKCNNIFLDEHERAKVGDFGLAKILEHTEQTSTLCGTIGYMAPEVCRNVPYGCSADIWSLGVIVYELISLKQPFKSQNSNMLSVVQKICEDEPDPLPGNYSRELINLCKWMLKKDSDQRPTARDLIATRYLQNEVHSMKTEILRNQEGS
ncbi:NIMA related kinase 2, putative (NEK2) [Plasmodium ovale wallikeri]|uniref:non-specific serine/threonine protein kinase n=2 Tax=Plasmodium ovale TaxID=36330 RepID=A0A1A8YX93_PLAOA|nr:NIMA related kinase 2, putative (NEK2) [Plasmodium ovale wallikeri]SBT36439.1 NIMA related kinase 2, putative (NEK2) [Plasmodium ovale wallikeri]SBT77410.1 NIMA related kinase 2, putative [Plasmodium ovale]